jgi:hypothetical protein
VPAVDAAIQAALERDLPATARLITDPDERRKVIEGIFRVLGRDESGVEGWVARSPLAAIEFIP